MNDLQTAMAVERAEERMRYVDEIIPQSVRNKFGDEIYNAIHAFPTQEQLDRATPLERAFFLSDPGVNGKPAGVYTAADVRNSRLPEGITPNIRRAVLTPLTIEPLAWYEFQPHKVEPRQDQLHAAPEPTATHRPFGYGSITSYIRESIIEPANKDHRGHGAKDYSYAPEMTSWARSFDPDAPAQSPRDDPKLRTMKNGQQRLLEVEPESAQDVGYADGLVQDKRTRGYHYGTQRWFREPVSRRPELTGREGNRNSSLSTTYGPMGLMRYNANSSIYTTPYDAAEVDAQPKTGISREDLAPPPKAPGVRSGGGKQMLFEFPDDEEAPPSAYSATASFNRRGPMPVAGVVRNKLRDDPEAFARHTNRGDPDIAAPTWWAGNPDSRMIELPPARLTNPFEGGAAAGRHSANFLVALRAGYNPAYDIRPHKLDESNSPWARGVAHGTPGLSTGRGQGATSLNVAEARATIRGGEVWDESAAGPYRVLGSGIDFTSANPSGRISDSSCRPTQRQDLQSFCDVRPPCDTPYNPTYGLYPRSGTNHHNTPDIVRVLDPTLLDRGYNANPYAQPIVESRR